MAFCTKCGQSVKDTANFCGFCGQALGGVSSPTKTSPAEPSPPTMKSWSSDGGAQPDVDIPGNPWICEPPRVSNQALEPGELFSPKPNTSPAARSGPRGKLILFTILFAAAGLILILAVAPEQTRWQNFVGYVVTEYYWMAIAGGAVCLLLAGVFLVAAIVSSGPRA